MRAKSVAVSELRSLLDSLDAAGVECDGMTRLVCTVLANAGIEHQAYVGSLQLDSGATIPHLWVEVGDVLIDYRARMWLGNTADVPHGVVLKGDLCISYSGQPIDVPPLSAALFTILALPAMSGLNAPIHANTLR